MTFNDSDIQEAIRVLQQAEAICSAQIQVAPKKASNSAPLLSSVTKLVSSGWNYFGYHNNSSSSSINKKDKKDKTDSSISTSSSISVSSSKTVSKKASPSGTPPVAPKYMTNGEIRARVIRAESLLLESLILLFQESLMSYLKAAMNLRKGKLNVILMIALEGLTTLGFVTSH